MAGVTVLLLRGVNVSGANRLPMAAFRAMLTDLGLRRVHTYIQSGNAVFDDPGLADLPDLIAAAMRAAFGFAPAMILLPLPVFDAILAANPYRTQGEADGAKVHLIFLAAPARDCDLETLCSFATGGEALHLTDSALYLLTPSGLGRSVLAEKIPRYVKTPQTARNQRTATAISALGQNLCEA